MRKTALRLSSSAVSIPIAELEDHARGWLLDGQIRQLSPNTTAARRFLIEKPLWFQRQREHATCGAAELRTFLQC